MFINMLLAFLFICAQAQQVIDTDQELEEISKKTKLLESQIKLDFSLAQNDEFIKKFAEGIYQNETGCDISKMVYWSKQEAFPSLGIGHFIWFPKNTDMNVKQIFPDVANYIKNNKDKKLKLPQLLELKDLTQTPWVNRKAFLAGNQNQIQELREFLSKPEVIKLQAQFMLSNLKQNLYKILAATQYESGESSYKQMVEDIRVLTSNQEGLFSLADYLAFKTEGIDKRYSTATGKFTWGLKDVLENIHKFKSKNCKLGKEKCLAVAFANSAQFVLDRRGDNDSKWGPDYQKKIKNWANTSWKNRINKSYRPGSFARFEEYKKQIANGSSENKNKLNCYLFSETSDRGEAVGSEVGN